MFAKTPEDVQPGNPSGPEDMTHGATVGLTRAQAEIVASMLTSTPEASSFEIRDRGAAWIDVVSHNDRKGRAALLGEVAPTGHPRAEPFG